MLKHQLSVARKDIRYYHQRRFYGAMLRALFWVLVMGHQTELCQDCGRRYERGLRRRRRFFLWWSPQPLWNEVQGRYGGLLCPMCFNEKARDAGYSIHWTPIVVAKDGVATTNHWFNETRDWLFMGIPDPEYPDRSEPRVWAIVRDALWEAGYDQPPLNYYPASNFALPSRSLPEAGR